MRVRYGTSLDMLAKALEEITFATDDPSFDVLYALATAYHAVKRLEEAGIDITFNGAQLILPSLERAYREALHVRKDIQADWLDDTWITRYGRFNAES